MQKLKLQIDYFLTIFTRSNSFQRVPSIDFLTDQDASTKARQIKNPLIISETVYIFCEVKDLAHTPATSYLWDFTWFEYLL